MGLRFKDTGVNANAVKAKHVWKMKSGNLYFRGYDGVGKEEMAPLLEGWVIWEVALSTKQLWLLLSPCFYICIDNGRVIDGPARPITSQ